MKRQQVSGFIKTAALVMLSLQLTGCAADSPMGILFHPPECSIISLEKQDGAFAKSAKIVMTVQNKGEGANAYKVRCTIKLKTGNTIIEASSAYFGNLKSGEAALDIVAFSRIEKHNEYDHAEYTLHWYDAEGGYYEK